MWYTAFAKLLWRRHESFRRGWLSQLIERLLRVMHLLRQKRMRNRRKMVMMKPTAFRVLLIL